MGCMGRKVPEERIELSPRCRDRILSPARLPVPPLGLGGGNIPPSSPFAEQSLLCDDELVVLEIGPRAICAIAHVENRGAIGHVDVHDWKRDQRTRVELSH